MILFKEEKVLCQVLVLFLYTLIVTNFFRLFKVESSYILFITIIIYGAIGLFVIYHCVKYKRFFPHIFLLVGLGVVVCVSILINDNIMPVFLNNLPYLISFLVIGFYLSYELNDYDYFFELLKKIVPFGSVFSILYFYSFDLTDLKYSMGISYMLLLPAIFAFERVRQHKTILNLFFLLSILFTIIMIGSRGALVCFGVFILLDHMFRMFATWKIGTKSVFGYIIGVCLLIFFSLNMNSQFFNDLFLESRTLNMISNDSFFTNDSGRNQIYSICIDYIIDNPAKGLGVFGDRLYLDKMLFLSDDVGMYPHNLVLELFMQYGVVLGILFCFIAAIVFYKAAKNIFRQKNNVLIDLFVFVLSIGLLPLMFSGSYIINNNFGVLMGFCLNVCMKCKRNVITTGKEQII